ncbi:hypothetical protein HC931_00980 [Candidatus Gracilibacteria bacterium]|nr:hypothetical protein [Candidatus Gracilibacteria bacterium]NJM87383.1 hypothetical protein [Hydrococcus sp. RU_2_2]NJP19046.1 hypothetical protein [Hydrococcus sp. CRU_1_1]NJQ98539.1 hypothetical protein [Hydrococcus sp. CSU_1_8]
MIKDNGAIIESSVLRFLPTWNKIEFYGQKILPHYSWIASAKMHLQYHQDLIIVSDRVKAKYGMPCGLAIG